MKLKRMNVYILFESIHFLLSAEKRLRELGKEFELRPNPAELNSACGMCAIINEEELKEVEHEILKNFKDSDYSLYIREKNTFKVLKKRRIQH